MKIMLHGATNCKSSNFGDYIYGELIYQHLKKQGHEVCFYQLSTFFEKYLPHYAERLPFTYTEADMILYIPGGYFGEGHNARFQDNIVQFMRFMPLGIKASIRKIPIAVIAVGAGPNKNIFMNFGIKRICNHAKLITVRDHTSYIALKDLCPLADVKECGDLILSEDFSNLVTETEQIKYLMKKSGGRKIILVHYNHEKAAVYKFAKVAKNFVNTHPEYYVVVTSDSVLDMENELFKDFRRIYDTECSLINYSDPKEMISLLQKVDVVLTCKLHVGVVSCCLGKSVIAAACHPEKTMRFYEEINEKNRCVDLYSISEQELGELLERYYTYRICISDLSIKKANYSWTLLDNLLEANDEQ